MKLSALSAVVFADAVVVASNQRDSRASPQTHRFSPLVVTARIAHTVVLAAGLGTRMKSRTPKVLHSVCGIALVKHVLRAAAVVPAVQTVVVLGHGHEQVRPLLPPEVRVALQEEQKGTGHAVLAAAGEIAEGSPGDTGGRGEAGVADPDDQVDRKIAGRIFGRADMGVEGDAAPGCDGSAGSMLILPGDTPLVKGEVLEALVEGHVRSGATATVLTMELDDPTGYGRVIRGEGGLVERIVEHRDATPEELAVREVNSGMYVLPVRRTLEILRTLGTDNAQGELYLTDVIAALRAQGAHVGAVGAPDARRLLGVNTRVELAEATAIMRADICRTWMLAGVTIDDPESTSIDAGVTLQPDVRLLPFTLLCGSTVVERDSIIGPFATVRDCFVGAGCHVYNSFMEGISVPPGTEVGPFACLRDG